MPESLDPVQDTQPDYNEHLCTTTKLDTMKVRESSTSGITGTFNIFTQYKYVAF